MKNKFRLDEVTTITMGQAPPGESYNSEKQGWPLIAGAGDFHGRKAKASKFTTSPSKISNTGDIILGIRASIGEKVISDREYCLGRGVAGIRPSDRVNPSFLWHWLTHNTRNLAAKGKGATFKQVNRKDIGEMEIKLPSLEEQDLLSTAIDSVESAREARQRSIELLDELTQSIFLDMFSKFSIDEANTEELGTHIDFLTSGSRGWAKHYSDEPGDVFLRIQNVRMNELNLTDVAYVNAPDTAEAKRTLTQPGDVLLSITADLGRTAVVPAELERAFINQHLSIIRTRKLNPTYLSAYLSSEYGQRQILKKNRAGVKAGLNFNDIRSLEILIPPRKMQEEFASRLESVRQLKAKHQAHLAHLDELFSSVQQRAFNGTLWDDSDVAA